MPLSDERSCETLGSNTSQNPRRKNECVHFVLTRWHVTIVRATQDAKAGDLPELRCLRPAWPT